MSFIDDIDEFVATGARRRDEQWKALAGALSEQSRKHLAVQFFAAHVGLAFSVIAERATANGEPVSIVRSSPLDVSLTIRGRTAIVRVMTFLESRIDLILVGGPAMRELVPPASLSPAEHHAAAADVARDVLRYLSEGR